MPSDPPVPVDAIWLGRQPYEPVFRLQNLLVEARKQGEIGDVILLLEHEPTITLGRGAKAAHLLAAAQQIEDRGIAVVESNRGGDVTLHAPGQLVAYPIVDLTQRRRDVRRYVQGLTEAMGNIVRQCGVEAGSFGDLVGLWADRQMPRRWDADQVREPVKLGAIGVRVSRWVTMHGFALNLTTDLSLFRWIIPCGIKEYGVASVASLGFDAPSPEAAASQAQLSLCAGFGAIPGRFHAGLGGSSLTGIVERVPGLVDV